MSGCGQLGGGDDSGSSETTSNARTDLTITVWPQGTGGASRTWTLRCDPVGGSLPNAERACERLTGAALKPLPAGTICTQIYGGPQAARVRGRFDGRPVDVRFNRTNGCEISRWNGATFLFPVRI
jgi:hypothetical protein